MAAGAGRDLRWKYDSGGGPQVIAGAQSDDFSINQGMINITDKDDNGIRTLLDDIGTHSISGTCSGVLKDTTLIALVSNPAGTKLHDMELDVIGLGFYAGSFFISNFEVKGEEGENPTTFTCKYESSGPVLFTPAP